ncbi:polysaccharide deacetylase family protein [Alkalicoccus chagannorensis]|uniref:polysaccharide deacetylase family protein n=1 Tax=Alkalicoccus chagannorensis TaxID=427072 RepID=UPI00041D8EC6|nr:polysaccharide deacetylase family protein [Alkalicoccus chagannorensis]
MVTDEVEVNFKDPRIVSNIRGTDDTIYLTFDDGPGRWIHPILDALARKGAAASFFWQGRLLHPERPWQRLLDEGHQIGSHAHSHKDLSRLRPQRLEKEMRNGWQSFYHVTGTAPALFRPPFGRYNEEVLRRVRDMHMQTVMWSISSFDWNCPADQVLDNVLSTVRGGDIVLLHELRQTAALLPEMLTALQEKGWQMKALPADLTHGRKK